MSAHQDSQRILKIVDELTKVQMSDQDNYQEVIKVFIEQFMPQESADFAQISESEQITLTCKAFDKLLGCLQLLSHEFKQLQQDSGKKLQNSLGNSKSKGKSFDNQDVQSVVGLISRIVRIQAWWRKVMTMKNLHRQIESERQNLYQRKEMESAEESALKEFATQLSKKKITPEAFFRICDIDCKQSVRVDVFKDQLQKFGIQLSRGQMSRLVMILDEDIEGSITRDEYYNCLEAYNISGEKHKSLDGTVYYQFEQKVLFKLISELRIKDITFSQMFNACDINDDARVNIQEIRKFVEGLNPEFKVKEIYALMNYIDIDKNGMIEKDEFIRQLTRGEQTFKQSQILQKQQMLERPQSASTSQRYQTPSGDNNRFFQSRGSNMGQPQIEVQENNFFEEEGLDKGDQFSLFGVHLFGSKEPAATSANKSKQSMLPDINNKNQKAIQGKQPQQSTSNQKPIYNEVLIKAIIKKMENEGKSFQDLLTTMRRLQVKGEIPLGVVLKTIEQQYPTISMKEKLELVKGCIVKDQFIDYSRFEEIISKFSTQINPSEQAVFNIIANNINKRMQGNSPVERIKAFLRAQGLQDTDQIPEQEFQKIFGDRRFATLSPQELAIAFNSLDLECDGFIKIIDLIQVLVSYTQSGENFNAKDIAKMIPGFEQMSPRGRVEELVEYIMVEMKKKNLQPLNAFKMAVTKDQNNVQPQQLEQAFSKLLPNIRIEIFQEAMKAFTLNGPRDLISRSDFETVFHDQQNAQYIPFSGSLPKNTDQFSASKASNIKNQFLGDEDENIRLIRKLDNAMLREGLSPAVAFKAADLNHNGIITLDELREAFKRFIPDNALSLAELKKMMVAFDISRNGMIEEQEFLNAIERARDANVTIVESPLKGRILSPQQNEQNNADRKNKLPLKQNQTGQNLQINDKQILSESYIAQVVQQLESQMNLKKFFGEVNIQENGLISVNSLSQKFKNYKDQNGKGLLPNMYIDIVKYLDQPRSGQIDALKLIQFCLQQLKLTNKTDVVLELKYIANFIESQKQVRFTQQYFERSSSLKSGIRIKEVDVLTEFQKLFQISISQTPIIYKYFDTNKKGRELLLEDICRSIDQFRLVQQDPLIQKTAASKLNPEQVIIKYVTQICGMTQAKYQRFNQEILQIFTKEKGLFYNSVFNLIVSNDILTTDESKAFFERMKQQSTLKNGIDQINYNKIFESTEQSILQAQEEAFQLLMEQQGIKYIDFVNKIRLNDFGFIIKTSVKEQLGLLLNQVLNKYGNDQLNNPFFVSMRSILNLDQTFVFPNKFQPLEIVNEELSQQLENCKFWDVYNFLTKLSPHKDPLDELIYKFLGKLLDNLGPNKPTYQIIQQVSSDSVNIRNADALYQMIVKLYQNAVTNVKGQIFQHGQITNTLQKECDLIWQSLGSKLIQNQTDDSILIQKINRHRGKLQQRKSMFEEEKNLSPDQSMAPGIQDGLTEDQLYLVQQIEDQMREPIEVAIEDKLFEESLTPQLMTRLLKQNKQNVDKNLTSKLCRMLDYKQQGKVLIRDLVQFLKKIPERYNQNFIKQQLKDIDEPFKQTLENQGFSPKDQFQKEDFYSNLSNIINVTKFQSVCLFYEMCDSEVDSVISTEKFVKYVEDTKNSNLQIQRPSNRNVSFSGSKKVSFSASNQEFVFDKQVNDTEGMDEEQGKLVDDFVRLFDKLSQPFTIKSAITKMCQQVQQCKNLGSILLLFTPEKKGVALLVEVRDRLDNIQNLTNEEKLIVTFLGFTFEEGERYETDINSIIRIFKSQTVDQNLINEVQAILQKVLQVVKKNKMKPGSKTSQQQLPQKQSPQQQFEEIKLKPVEVKQTQELKLVEMKSQKTSSFSQSGKLKEELTKSDKQEISENMRLAMEHISPQITKGLQNQNNLNRLKQILKSNNGAISQFEFFNFIKQELKVQATEEQFDFLSEQIEDYLEVEINVENLQDMFTELKIPIKLDPQLYNFVTRNQVKEKYQEKSEQDPKLASKYKPETVIVDDIQEFQINPQTDFFRGIPTILNNEMAAIAQAHRLYQMIPEGQEFFDIDFGPKDENDKDGNRFALYCKGEPPGRQFIDPENIEWLDPEQYIPEAYEEGQVRPGFVQNSFSAADVKQGNLGDCWFISALSILACRDELIMGDLNIEVKANLKIRGKDIDKLSGGIHPPIFHMYRKKGMFVFRFFKNFQWRYVIIDERLPCTKSQQKPYFATCKDLNEQWVSLIEKAYAKLHGCYEALLSGYIDDAISEMTGLVSEKLKMHNERNLFPHKSIKDKEWFWNYIMEKKQFSLMGCSSSGETEGMIKFEGRPSGIMSGHAYAIIDAIEIENPDLEKERKSHRLLRVRNPWGQTEWQGKWSDFSDEMLDTRKELIERYFASHQEREVDERFKYGENDGTFLINYASWRDIYNNVFLTFDFPDAWNAIRCTAEWDEKCCGGTPTPFTEEAAVNWAKNPQFLFAPKNKTEVFISLAQIDGRARFINSSGQYDYFKYPFAEVISPICIMVYKLEPGKTRIEKYNKLQIHSLSIIRESREVSLRVFLEAGQSYVIVPCTKQTTDYGKFYLSLYFDQKLRDCNIKRIDDITTKFFDIEEETENYDMVPKWKKKIVQARLKDMISGGNDQEANESMLASSQNVKLGQLFKVGIVKNKQDTSYLNNSENASFMASGQVNIGQSNLGASYAQRRGAPKKQNDNDHDEFQE